MELLEAHKTAYLLNASLESLHTESIEWLKETGFWQEEMSFIYKILRRPEIKQALPPLELDAIDQEMISISAEILGKVIKSIKEHEHDLQLAIQAVRLGEEQRYRHAHSILLTEMNHLFKQIREFKKKVFAFISRYEYLAERMNRIAKY